MAPPRWPGEAGDRDRRQASELRGSSPRVHSPVFIVFLKEELCKAQTCNKARVRSRR